MSTTAAPRDRVERERRAYEELSCDAEFLHWYRRADHVFKSPNTLRAEERWREHIRAAARGGRALDVGCGRGLSSRQALDLGADYVLGVDLAESQLAEARKTAIPGRLEFARHDLHQPLDGQFDLIFGRAILHHIDYRPVIERLYQSNLAAGGMLLFMEPLGTNLITRLFHRLTPSAHTPDERPLRREELAWFEARFSSFELVPINYFTYPAGILSSLLLRWPDNALMRAADRLDRSLERRAPGFHHHFRQGILVVRKPPP
jgi:SAM-dependent methyltransferase